jgi:hypothetical protein
MWGEDGDDNVEDVRPFAASSSSSTGSGRVHDDHIGLVKWSVKEKIGDEEFDVSGKVGNERMRISM